MSGINYQALREAAQNYQSMLAWYQEKPDSPNAEQDCDAALAACNQVNHLIPTRVLVKGGEITCKILK